MREGRRGSITSPQRRAIEHAGGAAARSHSRATMVALALLVLSSVLSGISVAESAAGPKPNVLFM